MKFFFLLIILISTFIFTPFNKASGQESDLDIKYSIPVLNVEIVAFVKTQIGKRVKRGECWDLAAVALNNFGAKWNGEYVFGREINPLKERVFPGDIIQFSNVLIQNEYDGIRHKETMTKHTAIVYEVHEKGHFTLAHQNTAFSGRKVGLSQLNLEDITRGSLKIFRPVP